MLLGLRFRSSLGRSMDARRIGSHCGYGSADSSRASMISVIAVASHRKDKDENTPAVTARSMHVPPPKSTSHGFDRSPGLALPIRFTSLWCAWAPPRIFFHSILISPPSCSPDAGRRVACRCVMGKRFSLRATARRGRLHSREGIRIKTLKSAK
jgi:hypothetical protein